MGRLLARLVLNAASIYLTAWLLAPDMSVRGVKGALLASIAFGLMNFFVRPILLLFTLPLNILTLGLFTLVVNGLTLWLTAQVASSIYISGLGTAIIGALLISFFNWLLGVGERQLDR